MKATKSAKELAFLHDLYVATDWSERFASLVDKFYILPTEGQFLYVECGTGNHALNICEKLPEGIDFFCTESDAEKLNLAQAKSETVRAGIKFQHTVPKKLNFPTNAFDGIICDASFLSVYDLSEIWQEIFRVTEKEGRAGVLLATAGSFGEFFSVFWEALQSLKMIELGSEVESLITSLPTVSDAKEMAVRAGFNRVQSFTQNEIFEYEVGQDFLRSPLISDFLFPKWSAFVPEDRHVHLLRKIEEVINESRQDLNFQLSVKISMITGRKSN
jgi:ubiquinone/menaquinone biosynthesis C-methylase UbiE